MNGGQSVAWIEQGSCKSSHAFYIDIGIIKTLQLKLVNVISPALTIVELGWVIVRK